MRQVTLKSLMVLYVLLTLAVAVPMSFQTALGLRRLHALDVITSVGVGAGLLLLPMLFITGAWWTYTLVARSGGSLMRRCATVAVYSAMTIVVWLTLQVLVGGIESGVAPSWVVTLGVLLWYSSYLVALLAALTGSAALVAPALASIKFRRTSVS